MADSVWLPFRSGPVNRSIADGIAYLRCHQNLDGSWTYAGRGGTRESVGVTGLATLAFLNAGYDESDPIVSKAITWILSNQEADGSIQSGWGVYDTCMAVFALVATHNPDYDNEIQDAIDYLVDAQNDEGEGLTSSDPQYGGWGYYRDMSEWSDLSNTQFALMALDTAQLDETSDVWIKADTYFITRCQNREASNPDYNFYDDKGFIYRPSGTNLASGRSYGSMTAAGVWSLLLCGVDPTSDGRLQDALDWLDNLHYSVNQNHPIGNEWVYYYDLGLVKAYTMAEARGWNSAHNWYEDVSNFLIGNQASDGHWPNIEGGESCDTLATTEAILSLQVREIPTDVQRLSWMTFILHSNADLHVYDPLGRHVGKNYETGGIDIDIPNATYMSNDVQNITVPELEAGNYRIVLIGTGTGEYTLDVTGGVGNDTVSEDSYTGNIKAGEIHDSTVNVAMITWLTIHVEEPEPVDAMVPSATGTGNVSFISDAGTIEDLIALNESDMPEENPNVDFPHGLFRFNITRVNLGQIVNITIACPQDIPTTAQYWLCGPNGSIDNPQPLRWYEILMNSNDGDSVITITKQDGGIGDEDGVENGIIVDDGGPGIATLPIAAQVPTLTPIGLTALAGLLLVIGGSGIRKKRRN